MLTGVGVSNGLAWSADGATMYYIDSLERRVDRFAYDVTTGTPADRRPAFTVEEFAGIPDGMAIDADDHLWIAFWRGGAVRRFSPTGRLVEQIDLPVARTTSCCLGGDDLRTLFVTTARRSLRSDALDDDPNAGAVFAVGVDVPGVLASRWQPAPTP